MTAQRPARTRKTVTRTRKKADTDAPVTLAETGTETPEVTPTDDSAVTTEPASKPARKRRVTKPKAAAPAAEAVVESAAEETAEEKKPARKKAPAKPRKTPVRKKTAKAEKAEQPAIEQSAPVVIAEEVVAEETVAEPAPAPELPAAVAETAVPEADAATAPEEKKTLFRDLGLSEPILKAIAEMGYTHPTQIQEQAIPAVLMAKDVLGVAQTGTGKTASFTLPMLEILSDSRARARMPRSLILEPTRELALQVAENFVNYGKHLKLTHALLIGGESMADQKEVLNRGVDVLIATPGRLLDLFDRGGLLMNQTRILVIDEADRMLDMGFIPDIEKIVALLPPNRQTLFFSATMAPAIRKLADAFLHSPKEITVARPSSVATTIETGLVIVDEFSKRETLRQMLRVPELQNAIVFCNRKRDVDILMRSLSKHGFSAGCLHGDMHQSARFTTLEKFKNNELKILVCSDVAARGIDIGGLSHVFNFDLPFQAEDYVHRIGRTGRAGRTGHAYSIASPYDKALVDAIEKLTEKPIPLLKPEGIETLEWSEEKRPPRGNRQDQSRRNSQGNKDRQNKEAAPRNAPAQPAEQDNAGRNATKYNPKKSYRERDRQREEIQSSTQGNDVPGFGQNVPAFMMLPRRTTILSELATAAEPGFSEDNTASETL